MKKIKLLFIIFSMYMLSGCTVYYNFNIDESLNINEEINFKYDNLNFDQENSTIDKEYYDNLLASVKKDAIDNNYTFIDNSVGNDKNFSLQKTSSFNNFKDPIFLEGKYERFKTFCNNDYCYLTASAINNDIIGEGDIVYLNIGISVPYEVIKNNASSFDEKTNKYYWNYSPISESKNIEIVFKRSGKNIVEDYKAKSETKSIIFVIIGVLFISVVLFIGAKFLKTNKAKL